MAKMGQKHHVKNRVQGPNCKGGPFLPIFADFCLDLWFKKISYGVGSDLTDGDLCN